MGEQFTVIFDFDGTLANTLGLAIRIYNENLSSFGSKKVEINHLEKYQKLGYKKTMKELNIRWTMLPRIALFISREMKQHMREVRPYPGIIDTLNKLQKKGISMGILTSNSSGLVQDFFDTHKFPKFDFIVSDKTLFSKDKALKKIIKSHELNTGRVIYVGDEPRDVKACQKANVPVIGVSWGLGGVSSLTPSKPDKIVHTSKELLETIIMFENSTRA